MATKAKTVPAFEPDAEYDLVVARPVQIRSAKYLPRHAIIAKGSLINLIVEEHGADAIRSAEPR